MSHSQITDQPKAPEDEAPETKHKDTDTKSIIHMYIKSRATQVQ